MLPTLLLGGGRGAGSPSTHISAHPAAMQKQELARKEGRQAELLPAGRGGLGRIHHAEARAAAARPKQCPW